MIYHFANFETASIEFKSLLQTNDNPNFRFYYAMSLLNWVDLESASRDLEQLSKTNFEYKAEALWYNALIKIKTKDFDAALKYLEALDNSNSTFKSKERKVLLQKLKD